ncbi:MAG: MTH1187 family thiamine-binding protein [Mahellales bacterium]
MAILEISITPLGTDEASFSSYISDACKVVKDRGMKYQITPTATIIEGSVEELMEVAKKMHQTPFNKGVNRVITNMTIDERTDKNMDLGNQVQSVTRTMM